MTKLFSDLCVVELASVLAGPSVGQFFEELGARVIKVENSRTKGDVTRSWKLQSENKNKATSAYFASINMGKEHVFLDLQNSDERKKLFELLAKADVVLTSYKAGDAEKFGLDYVSVKKQFPRLIYGQITGYGLNDERTGYDAIIQAESGFMSMNGAKGGQATKLPVALMDILAGHQLKEGILCALLKRERSGEGSHVHVSLIQAAVSALANQASNYLMEKHVAKPMGSEHPNIAPYGSIYTTKDGIELVLAIGTNRQFIELCELLELQQLALDRRFNSNPSRVQNRDELNTHLQEAIGEQIADRFLAACQTKRLPVGKVNKMDAVFEQKEAAELIRECGDLRAVGTVVFNT